jgi:hypothetical protein
MTWANASSYTFAGEPQDVLEQAVLGVLSIGGPRHRSELTRWLMEHGATAICAHLAIVTLLAESRLEQLPGGALSVPRMDCRPGQAIYVSRPSSLWSRIKRFLRGRP